MDNCVKVSISQKFHPLEFLEKEIVKLKKIMWGSVVKLLLAVMLTFSLFTPNISFAQSTSVKSSEKNKAIESYVIDEIAENRRVLLRI